MRFITRAAQLACALLLGSGLAHGETAATPAAPAVLSAITIATGDYAPFVSEQLPDGGVTAEIVRASLRTQGLDAQFDYVPWRRGYQDALHGTYAATFPYLKNAEREAAFLFSDPIMTDRLRIFVRKENAAKTAWEGRSICVPIGHDVTSIQEFVVRNKLTLERPLDMSKCFKMLDVGRTTLIWSSEAVADGLIFSMFGRDSGIATLNEALEPDVEYYFIVSKSRPDAVELMTRFNNGLRALKSSGGYAKIVKRFMKTAQR